MRVALLSMHTSPLAPLGQKDTGGMNVCIRETAREMGRRGICVDVYTRQHDPREPAVVSLGQNAWVIHLRAGPWDAPKETLFNHVSEFSSNVEEYARLFGHRYDLVHGHYWLSGLAALHLQQRWGIPAVASFHSLGKVQRLVRRERESRQRGDAEALVVHGADQIVAGSPDEREQLLRLYAASPEKTHVVPCGFDRELFRPHDTHEARRKLGLRGSKIVLFVGRLHPVKGADIVLRAAAALDDREGLQIVVIGGAPGDAEAGRLRRLARELRIESNLLFVGSVPQEKLPLYYSAADVCVVPSYYETFGLVAVEAMACGTPVVAARVGGLQATIVDGRTGYLVPWHCPEPYAERLEVVLGNEALRARLGKAARESVDGLTWAFAVDKLLDVYGMAVGHPAVAPEMIPCAAG